MVERDNAIAERHALVLLCLSPHKAYKLRDSAEKATGSVLFQHVSKFTQHAQRESRCYIVIPRGEQKQDLLSQQHSSHQLCPLVPSDLHRTIISLGGVTCRSEARKAEFFACSEMFSSVVVIVVVVVVVVEDMVLLFPVL